ncbi:MAG: 6,7-dimethyl-8-ribityllumazine synthase [Candidatus Omnitrophica bacterium]|nr:6,7-dimethyl-8-ribityllumazine synthase [Candidatus Omnitrophota bacterium]
MSKKSVKSKMVTDKILYAVIVARFHEHITEKMLKACLKEFSRLHIDESQVQVVRVPGAFEIPVMALKLAQKKNICAVICLGAIIKGQTLHYELVAEQSARGIQEVALKTGKPIIFEVLAADSQDLCEARAQEGDRDNKGASAARVAVEMVETLRKV